MKLYFGLILPLLLFSHISYGENRPGFVCGQFNKNIIEVPAEYVFPFAEYEGYSYFDPRFVENKKGCEANFRILPMRMSWPEMKPIDSNENIKIIRVSIEPLDGDVNGYLEYKRYLYLDRGEEKIKGEVLYDEKINLYFSDVELKRMKKNIDPEYYKNRYYWELKNNDVNTLFECIWIPFRQEYSDCDAIFLIENIGVKVRLNMIFDDLIMWEEIKNDIVIFLNQKMINRKW
nr:hypothetical protein [Providencia sp. PROV195]